MLRVSFHLSSDCKECSHPLGSPAEALSLSACFLRSVSLLSRSSFLMTSTLSWGRDVPTNDGGTREETSAWNEVWWDSKSGSMVERLGLDDGIVYVFIIEYASRCEDCHVDEIFKNVRSASKCKQNLVSASAIANVLSSSIRSIIDRQQGSSNRHAVH